MGLPVLVSDNSENSFWVKGSGLLFKDGDANGISNGIMLLANDVRLREEFGRNGRARISKDNDYITEMTKVNALYLSICNKVE